MTKGKLKKILRENISDLTTKISFISPKIEVELEFIIYDNGFEYSIELINDGVFNPVDVEKKELFEDTLELIANVIIDFEQKYYKMYIGEEVEDEDPIDSFFK